MVTGKINGQDVTVPAGTTILEAARIGGVDVPNLCYQPLLRPWGSCRICTVEILGKRGGLIESCATPMREGMEVLTHSEPAEQARQFVLQMYLIDHALDCPTCDKSGECYLQDNTYLHNVNTNPYRRPKFAKPYVHLSDLIDFKHDRCIMCTRCTRVCDEMIGVTAIEATHRSIEATITPAFGQDLSETLCTNCGMCIAVCPVGALTDRQFAFHPWELDTTETICGQCDVGCTINVESNKGVIRRVTNLWERGVNHGYVCYHGKWGHEDLLSSNRIRYPRVNTESGHSYEVTWDDCLETVANTFAHYQGDEFAAILSPEGTNEDVYTGQKFARQVMGSGHVDRNLSPSQVAVERSVSRSLGRNVAHTNNLQEMLTDAKASLVVGPDIGKHAPVASYWLYHSRIYLESKTVVVSEDEFPLCWRAEVWLKPNPGTTADVLNAMARIIRDEGLGHASSADLPGGRDLAAVLEAIQLDAIIERTGVDRVDLEKAAAIYASGGVDATNGSRPPSGPSVIYQTAAHLSMVGGETEEAEDISQACSRLAMLTGNLGREGSGIASMRGPANAQGAFDMRAVPDASIGGIGFDQMLAAIDAGRIKSMYIEGNTGPHSHQIEEATLEVLRKLEFLVVADAFDTPLAQAAHVVLPRTVSLEVDGTFTSFDRTVQRVRASVPAVGEAMSPASYLPQIAQAMGLDWSRQAPAQIMNEIGKTIEDYAGVNYSRLERSGVTVPVKSFGVEGIAVLVPGEEGAARLTPSLASSAAD